MLASFVCWSKCLLWWEMAQRRKNWKHLDGGLGKTEVVGIAAFCLLDNVVDPFRYIWWIDKKTPSAGHYAVCSVTSLKCFRSINFRHRCKAWLADTALFLSVSTVSIRNFIRKLLCWNVKHDFCFYFFTSSRIAVFLSPMRCYCEVMNLVTFAKETTWYNYLKCFRLESSNVLLCVSSLDCVASAV